MENANKTNNFLNAIEKYAEQQKQQMATEVEEFKAAELKKAEDEGLKDAYNIIQSEIAAKRTSITSEFARREHECKVELFTRRKEMTEEIFSKVKQKLLDYTSTSEYKDKLFESAKQIAKLVGNNKCVMYLRQNDMQYSAELANLFDGEITAEAAKDIEIGGVKVFCKSMNIIADETLDSKLNLQINWFAENCSLKVV